MEFNFWKSGKMYIAVLVHALLKHYRKNGIQLAEMDAALQEAMVNLMEQETWCYKAQVSGSGECGESGK